MSTVDIAGRSVLDNLVKQLDQVNQGEAGGSTDFLDELTGSDESTGNTATTGNDQTDNVFEDLVKSLDAFTDKDAE